MKTLMLSHSDGGGGAGRAAYRLLQALSESGVDVSMHVDFKNTTDPRVYSNVGKFSGLDLRTRILAEQIPGILAGVANAGLFSPGLATSIGAKQINRDSSDLVNIHWTNMGYLSIETIGRITKPTVWTMHDMWAFSGGRNYPTPGDRSRWNVDQWVSQRKRRSWKTRLQLVAPSRWLAQCAAESPLLGTWPIEVIPNSLDTDVFKPAPQQVARQFHHLPQDVPIVLFALTTDLEDPRKGWDLLIEALRRLRLLVPSVELAVVGHKAPPGVWPTDLPRTHWLGRLVADEDLVMAYNSANVTVVPSRLDNLPQTGTESQSCGTPVVGFRVGGLPDVVKHQETGYLASSSLDPVDLAHGIHWVLSNNIHYGHASRERAVRLWSPRVISAQYAGLFDRVVLDATNFSNS